MASLLEALPTDVQQNILERVLPPGDRLDEDGLKSLHSLRATSKYMRSRIDGDDAYFEKLCKAIWCMKWQAYACDFRLLHRDYLMDARDVPVEDWGLIPRGVFREERIPWRRAFLGACRLFHRNVPQRVPASWDPYSTMGDITAASAFHICSVEGFRHDHDVVLQNLMGQIRKLGWDWEAQIQVTLGDLLSPLASDDRFPVVDAYKNRNLRPFQPEEFELRARQASIQAAELCGAAHRDAARVTMGQILSGIIPKNMWLTTVGAARVRERFSVVHPGIRNAMVEAASLCSLTGAPRSIEDTLPRIKELMKVGIPLRAHVGTGFANVLEYDLFAYGVLHGSVELLDLTQQVYRPKREAFLPHPEEGVFARFHEIFGHPGVVQSYLDVPLWTWDDDLFDYLIDLIPERCKEKVRHPPRHRFVEFLHHSFQLAIVKGRHRPIRRLISMGVFQANFNETRTGELRLRMGGTRSNLNMAVSEGNVELVTFLLKHKQPDKDVLFSIGMAVAQNRVEILRALLREYSQRLDHCEQMIVDALAHRNEEMLRILIKYGASVDPSRNVPAHRIPGWPGGQSVVEFARVCIGEWAADAVGGCHLRRAPPSPDRIVTDGTEAHWEVRHANDDDNFEGYDCDEQSDVEDYDGWSGEDDGGGNDEHNPDSYEY